MGRAYRVALSLVATAGFVSSFPAATSHAPKACANNDPFAIIDAQRWVNPDNMVWADWKAVPGIDWSDPTRKGSIRNFKIALLSVDYGDRNFTITQPVGSTVFGNPQPSAPKLTRADVPAFYRDLLNKPQTLNKNHTMHEYWMEDSAGRYGVDLTSYGPYRLPAMSYEYGIDEEDFNTGGCPPGKVCDRDLRTDAFAAWRADVGNATVSSYELVFISSAGQDESSTWQEFGVMKWNTKEEIPNSFGPPGTNGTNWSKTRYVDWTSWAAAATIWPNAGGGSTTQGESSGMAVYAHELSHLLNIGDNYNNPYGVPLRRSYTGPWSMMSRGSFNGPGGPHTRWQVPPLEGASLGSLHTMRDKIQLGLVANSSVLKFSRDTLTSSGPVVATLTARAVDPGTGLMGIRVTMNKDNSPACSISTDVLCDGGAYNNYDLEVVDRMGADSFTPDSGVLITKTKDSDNSPPFQWVIDSHPEDIRLVDFIRPNGSTAYITRGDYRQLADALFHAGTRSGTQFEFIDKANNLQFYVIEPTRDSTGVLRYTAAVRSLTDSSPSTKGVTLAEGKIDTDCKNTTAWSCVFDVKNTGIYKAGSNAASIPAANLGSDIYRLSASVTGSGWSVAVPNALAVAKFGSSTTARVAVTAGSGAAQNAVVKLTATSETNSSVSASAECKVTKPGYHY